MSGSCTHICWAWGQPETAGHSAGGPVLVRHSARQTGRPDFKSRFPCPRHVTWGKSLHFSGLRFLSYRAVTEGLTHGAVVGEKARPWERLVGLVMCLSPSSPCT